MFKEIINNFKKTSKTLRHRLRSPVNQSRINTKKKTPRQTHHNKSTSNERKNSVSCQKKEITFKENN